MSHDHSHGHDDAHAHTHNHSHGHQVPWDEADGQWYEPGWADPLLRRVVEAAELVASEVIVDFRCREGAALMAAAGWASRGRLVGLTGAETLAAARAAVAGHPEAARISIVAGEASALPEGAATVAWSIGPVTDWADPQAQIAAMGRVLRPGGRLLIAAEAESCGIGDAPDDPAPLRLLLRQAGFRGVEVRRYRDGAVRFVMFMASRARS